MTLLTLSVRKRNGLMLLEGVVCVAVEYGGEGRGIFGAVCVAIFLFLGFAILSIVFNPQIRLYSI